MLIDNKPAYFSYASAGQLNVEVPAGSGSGNVTLSVTTVAHELRTPLGIIIAETQSILAQDRTAAEYRETVEECLEIAQQMRRMTQSLLELARFDAGEAAVERGNVDLAEVARIAVERMAPIAAERGIGIECDLAVAMACTNADRISLLLMNLLSNAIEYNWQNGTVKVETRQDRDSALVTVSDTGIGIAEADLPRIFDRFYRASKVRSRAGGHIGLGLGICKAIVNAEGGNISVRSVLHEGSRFIVCLPGAR